MLVYLCFELSDSGESWCTLEAMASTHAAEHALVLAEAQQVLDWAWQRFAHSHGPADEGMDWDHELQVHVEPGDWHTVTLTLTGSAHFLDEFQAAFGGAEDGDR